MTQDELNELAKAWPGCELWDWQDDREEYTHRCIFDAIEQALDSMFEHGVSTMDMLEKHWPNGITIYGFDAKEVGDADVEALARAATDAVLEHWTEHLELSNPNEDEPQGKLPELFAAAIREDLKTRHVWTCEQSGEVELTHEQLVGIARLMFPHWFEEDEEVKNERE